MRQANFFRSGASLALGLAAAALMAVGADDAKQPVEARGLTFDAPKAWKASPPSSQFRIAQMKVEPAEGDDYPAEMVVTAFAGGAGSVDANIQRWQGMFKDDDGKPPMVETKKVQGQNVEVIRAETHGTYTPSSFGGRPDPVRKDARLLGVIIPGGEVTYYIRMVGPDKTMKKLMPDFDDLLKTIKVAN